MYIYEEVCYTLTGVTSGQVATECEEAFELVDAGCEAAECSQESPKWQVRVCGDEEWVDTESDLSSYAPSEGSVYVWGDGDAPTCYEVRRNDASSGTGNAINLSGFSNYSDTATPCDCCNNFNVVEYIQCDLASPASGS